MTTSPNGATRSPLIALRDPRSAAAEAYRTLRTNIQFSSLDRQLHTLLATSSAPDEGKSTTIANLAVTMAQAEQRVILVDCDLRRPTLHTLFGLPNDAGLTSTILAQDDADIPLLETGVPGLSLLASGPLPPRPADILGSRKMEAMISRLRGLADIVLFDTPPVVAVTDAAVLATRVDGVLLVFQAGKTSRERGRQARQILEKVKANIVGVVLNNAKVEQGYGYYG
ncbi:MAG TPA: CpsD/CapB family tyrosine-protein kinase [Kouleothrix sp.]|nr:CpsD/CapB family tyrosine-protein kinase [Kouleothrix sp.]HRC77223.1 CpsD/CapB family tyrosine-protein kinase [Kouleothrix sp.]